MPQAPQPQNPARGGERGPAALPGVSLATQDCDGRKVQSCGLLAMVLLRGRSVKKLHVHQHMRFLGPRSVRGIPDHRLVSQLPGVPGVAPGRRER
jgi:hypothetical protein